MAKRLLYERDQLWRMNGLGGLNMQNHMVMASFLRLNTLADRLCSLQVIEPADRREVVIILEENGIDVGPFAGGAAVDRDHPALLLVHAQTKVADHDWAVNELRAQHLRVMADMADLRTNLVVEVARLKGLVK